MIFRAWGRGFKIRMIQFIKHSGATFGATNEIAEITVLLLGIVLIRMSPGLVDAPFW